MEKPYVEAEIKGVGRILRLDAPFDVNMQTMRKEGVLAPLTARELAYARTHAPEGKNSTLMTRGSYTKAGFVYMANEAPIRVASSPLLNAELAQLATQANRDGRYFSTGDTEVYERVAKIANKDKDKAPEKRRAIVLPSRGVFKISPMVNPEVFANIFSNAGQDYLSFLGFDALSVYPVESNTVDKQKGTILTQEWLARLDDYSDVSGDIRNLLNLNTVRGVPLTGGASRAKNSETALPYTMKDVRVAERELGRLAKVLQTDQIQGLQGLISKLRGK